MPELRVELLAFEGCPHLDNARRDLQAVLREGIVETPVQVVLVSSQEDAEFLGFPGSPTIRVDGEDVDPQPGLPFGLGCRVYRDEAGRLVGSPPIERIRAAVQAHRRGRLQAFQRDEAGLVADYAREAAESETAAGYAAAAGSDGTPEPDMAAEPEATARSAGTSDAPPAVERRVEPPRGKADEADG